MKIMPFLTTSLTMIQRDKSTLSPTAATALCPLSHDTVSFGSTQPQPADIVYGNETAISGDHTGSGNQDLIVKNGLTVNNRSKVKVKNIKAENTYLTVRESTVEAVEDINAKNLTSTRFSTIKARDIIVGNKLSVETSSVEAERDIRAVKLFASFSKDSSKTKAGRDINADVLYANDSIIEAGRNINVGELSSFSNTIKAGGNVNIEKISQFDPTSKLYMLTLEGETNVSRELTIDAIDDSAKEINVVLGEGINELKLILSETLENTPNILERFKFSCLNNHRDLEDLAEGVVKILRKAA